MNKRQRTRSKLVKMWLRIRRQKDASVTYKQAKSETHWIDGYRPGTPIIDETPVEATPMWPKENPGFERRHLGKFVGLEDDSDD